MSIGVNPVFVKTGDIPESVKKQPSVLEICLAGEKTAGQGSVVGAQQINGLWRIYPATQEARQMLLMQGLKVRGVVVQLKNTNPYILKDGSGEEKPATKVWIDNIPISVADSEIEHSLAKVGCDLRSRIISERARDVDHKLTRFLTGRRFAFITVPSEPLAPTLKVSVFTAKVFHREQKGEKKTVMCSKCLQQGHHASACPNDIVCRACRKPGHKRGDPACQIETIVSNKENVSKGESENESVSEKEMDEEGVEAEEENGESVNSCRKDNSGDRGRDKERQTPPRNARRTSPSPSRSATPKRPRSAEETSPELSRGRGKLQRRSGERKPAHQALEEKGKVSR